MPGIWGMISEKKLEQEIDLSKSFHREDDVTYLTNSTKYQKAYFGRFSVNKFQKDKIFEETDHNLICTDGIILNVRNLLHRYNILASLS